jgi:hypothetical protein
LVASWPTAFTDPEDPFSLDVEFAIGENYWLMYFYSLMERK